jgi:5'-nucleotidase
MNILIANDDGPDSEGLKALQTATKAAYPDAIIITFVPRKPIGGQGLSVTPQPLDDFVIEEVVPHFYVCDARPADLIYLALGEPERFLKRGSFDLVLTGINHGENIGMDVFHSGTVGMAMLASTFFGTTAVAFSQQYDHQEATTSGEYGLQPDNTIAFIRTFLRNGPRATGLCWNVNFPPSNPKGWKVCSVAYHSRFRPFKVADRKTEGCDVTELERGFIVVSPLCLNVVPPLIQPLNTLADSVRWACELDRIRL